MTPSPSEIERAVETMTMLANACDVSGLDHVPVVSRANAKTFAADLRTLLASIQNTGGLEDELRHAKAEAASASHHIQEAHCLKTKVEALDNMSSTISGGYLSEMSTVDHYGVTTEAEVRIRWRGPDSLKRVRDLIDAMRVFQKDS